MKKSIKLGYSVGSGNEVSISPAHLIVTGLTQKAGKTTTLESLISRSKKRAIVFRTKIGEKSFLNGTIIPPFFRDRGDWQFLKSLIEATIQGRITRMEQAKIIQICKVAGGNSILEFHKKVKERLQDKKISNFERDVLTNIDAYFDEVTPKLQTIQFSNTLELVEGLNIVDLERFARDPEVQSLIIRSVLEEVLYNFKDVIIVMPEAWKFIPQDRGNPCKWVVQEFIRQGATNGNFVWFDSQDMTGVDKTPLKQVTDWLLGQQSEINEVKHTLEQIPLPKSQKPKPEEIMQLGTGIFFHANRDRTIKIYIQPFWLDDTRSRKVALGELNVDDLDAPKTLTPFKIAVKKESITEQPTIDFQETTKRFNKELSEMGTDFFNKIGDLQEQINNISATVFELKNRPVMEIDEDAITRKVLQKIPLSSVGPPVDRKSIVKEVLSQIPNGSGFAVYEIKPIEKIRKDFLQEAKEKILKDISSLPVDSKKALKYIESHSRAVSTNEFVTKCFLLKDAGSARHRVAKAISGLNLAEIVKKEGKGTASPALRSRIENLLGNHNATDEEIDQVYDHILMEMLE